MGKSPGVRPCALALLGVWLSPGGGIQRPRRTTMTRAHHEKMARCSNGNWAQNSIFGGHNRDYGHPQEASTFVLARDSTGHDRN